jgi:type IV pilus assembly protein PilB
MSDKPVMGELLIREGLVSPADLERALKEQRSHGGRLGYHLIRLGLVNVQRLSQFLKDSMGLIPYDLVSWIKDPSVTEHIPANLAQFYQVVPVEKEGSTLTVAIADLDNPRIVPALEEYTGLTIDPVVCPRETVVRALEHFYGITKDPGVVKHETGDHLFIVHQPQKKIRAIHWSALKPDSAATEWLRSALAEAIRTGCRSLVVRPQEDSIRIAFRTAKGIEERFALDGRKRQEFDSLFSELARLKDRKRGSRQEGRVRVQVEGRFLSMHIKALGTLQGNRYAITLHDEKLFQGDWKILSEQLTPSERADMAKFLEEPQGMMLLAGPPGAGLNAVYYALMAILAQNRRQAIAVEDYILMPLKGVSQVEASRQEGISSPELILQALKQEPDLLAICPIKERKSAEVALLAAARVPVLGGIHQQGAAAVLQWLLDNQFKSALKAGVLKGILTVASVPLLCPRCKLPYSLPGVSGGGPPLMTRQGCETCLAWDALPTKEILEWFQMDPTKLRLDEGVVSATQLQGLIRDRSGASLAQRLLHFAQEGVIDGAEIRDYL